MDNRNHHLDAPNERDLQTIEQLNDHSELSGLYRHAHNEWEGKEIISDQERLSRGEKALLKEVLAIRHYALYIGLLIPLPFVLLMLIATGVLTTIDTASREAAYYMPVVLVALLIWFGISFNTIRRTLALFYRHGLQGVPFMLVTLILTALLTHLEYVTFAGLLPPAPIGQVAALGLMAMVTSALITVPLLMLWTSPKVRGVTKMIIILGSIIALGVLGAGVQFAL